MNQTTHRLTRSIAIEIIEQKVNFCTNDELAEILECIGDNTFRNFIVTDTERECIEGWPYIIDSANEF